MTKYRVQTIFPNKICGGTNPSHLARKRSGLKPQFLVAGLLLVGVIVSLMIYGLTTAKAYWLTVNEVHQRGDEMVSQRLRVNGVVVDGSEDWNAEEVTLRFKIQTKRIQISNLKWSTMSRGQTIFSGQPRL